MFLETLILAKLILPNHNAHSTINSICEALGTLCRVQINKVARGSHPTFGAAVIIK